MPPPASAETDLKPRVQELLRRYWGFDTLRPLQLEAVRAGVDQRDSLVVLPTGGGKSLCYQLPPLLTDRLTVVVSPLISLMKDQVDGLRLASYPAAAIHSGVSPDEVARIRREALQGSLKLLFVAPERVFSDAFISFMRSARVGSFAIDEAHCISQWGHDFRPEYRRLAELRGHFPELAFHAYTATATPRVRQDIIDQLSLREPEVLVGVFDRPNLTYRVLPRVSGDDQIEEVLRRHTGEEANGTAGQASIVYCISRKDTERLAAELTARGLPAEAYHAGLATGTRQRVQEAFASERLNTVVATVAFGMGIDRSDVRCVVHASMPKTVEHYQQETGRAGRDGLASECVLFYSAQDVIRWKGLMERSAGEAQGPVDPEALAAQLELLGHMQRLCSSVRCRHRALSEYFGQEYAAPDGESGECGACDVCLKELAPVPDATTIARKIISCVARLHQASGMGFGAAYIAEVLRGQSTAKVLQRRHETLTTFGLLRELHKDRIVSYINQLVDAELLARAPGEYPTLMPCAGSVPVLRGQREVALFDPRSPAAGAEDTGRGGGHGLRRRAAAEAPPLATEEIRLFESLRALRRATAERLGLPPYLVFSDATLEEMARVRPGSPATMAHIRGVGQAKLAEFGEAFAGHIAAYCRDHGLTPDAMLGSRPRRAVSAAAAGGGGPVTGAKRRAFEMFDRGSSVEEVSAETGRARSTAYEYLAEWINRTRPETVAPWVDDRTYAEIVEAAGKIAVPRFKPLFDHFGGSVSYDQIRVVMTHRAATQRTP